jgi:hypothetical protein
MRRFKTLFPMFLLCGLAIPCYGWAAESAAKIQTRKDLEIFMMTYYAAPRPELIAQAIDVVDSENIMVSNATWRYFGFFSAIFSNNSERLPEWEALIEKKSEDTRKMLQYTIKEGRFLVFEEPSAQRNDIAWGGFYASGEERFLKTLILDTEHMDERVDPVLFFAGSTAMKSLAERAKIHEKIQTMLEKERDESEGRRKQIINEILTSTGEQIEEQIYKIAGEQVKQGKWKVEKGQWVAVPQK